MKVNLLTPVVVWSKNMPNTISMPIELYEWDGELYSAFYNNFGGNNVGGVLKLKASDDSFIKAVKST